MFSEPAMMRQKMSWFFFSFFLPIMVCWFSARFISTGGASRLIIACHVDSETLSAFYFPPVVLNSRKKQWSAFACQDPAAVPGFASSLHNGGATIICKIRAASLLTGLAATINPAVKNGSTPFKINILTHIFLSIFKWRMKHKHHTCRESYLWKMLVRYVRSIWACKMT